MLGGVEREQARIDRSLEAFARDEHRRHPKRPKTMKLPNGTLKSL